MAISNIYRQAWTKGNGWGVRVDFIPSSSDAAYYDERSVTTLSDVFIEVKDHVCDFADMPIGMPNAQSCKFTLNYSNAPSAMQTALNSQTTSQTDAVLGSIDVSNIFVIWTNYGGGTYYPVFVGCQTPTPSDKFTVLKNGQIRIEIDAISVHKVAADRISIADIDTYVRGSNTYSPSFAFSKANTFYIAESKNVTTLAGFGYSSVSAFFGWFITLSEFHTSINYIYSSVMCTMLRQTFNVNVASYTKLSSTYNIATNTKFYKQDSSTALGIADLYMCAYVTKSNSVATDQIIGGLLYTDDKERTFAKDAKTLWELLGVLAPNFYSKYVLGYSKQTISSHDSLVANFNLLHILAGSTGAALQTIAYNAGTTTEWERNHELKKKCLIHTDIHETDVDNVATFEAAYDAVSKNGDGLELNFPFNWHTLNGYYDQSFRINSAVYDTVLDANTRTLFYSDTFGVYNSVSPLIAVRGTDTASYSKGFDNYSYKSTQDGWQQHEIKINTNQAYPLMCLHWFATTLTTTFGTVGQTSYEGQYTLSQYLLPHNVGDRFDITPHASFSVPTKSTMTSCTIDWSIKEALAECKFLTRTTSRDSAE